MDEVHTLAPVIILLSVGILAIALMRRIGLSTIVGYLIAGMLIGPYSLGLIHRARPRTSWLSSASFFFCSISGCTFR